MAAKPTVADLMQSHYETHFKSANYLFVAHGAGFIGCLSVLRDYPNAPQLRGIGFLILLFGVGLLAAILNYISLQFARSVTMTAIMNDVDPDESTTRFLMWLHFSALGVALVALIWVIVVIIARYASL